MVSLHRRQALPGRPASGDPEAQIGTQEREKKQLSGTETHGIVALSLRQGDIVHWIEAAIDNRGG
jgi:hypothetical protein